MLGASHSHIASEAQSPENLRSREAQRVTIRMDILRLDDTPMPAGIHVGVLFSSSSVQGGWDNRKGYDGIGLNQPEHSR